MDTIEALMWVHPDQCPDRETKHRPPTGPNEAAAQCPRCGSVSWTKRPWGETFGTHLKTCSLPIWHEGSCRSGGRGHPEAPVIRGDRPEHE